MVPFLQELSPAERHVYAIHKENMGLALTMVKEWVDGDAGQNEDSTFRLDDSRVARGLNLYLRRSVAEYRDPRDEYDDSGDTWDVAWELDDLGRPTPDLLKRLHGLGFPDDFGLGFVCDDDVSGDSITWEPSFNYDPDSIGSHRGRKIPNTISFDLELVQLVGVGKDREDRNAPPFGGGGGGGTLKKKRKPNPNIGDDVVHWNIVHGLGLSREDTPTHIDGHGRGLPDAATVADMVARGLRGISQDNRIGWVDKAGGTWVCHSGPEWRPWTFQRFQNDA